MGKSLEVLLRKKKKKSFAETLKRSPTAARMGREFAGEWTHAYVWLSPSTVHLKLSQYCQLALLQYKIKSLNLKSTQELVKTE